VSDESHFELVMSDGPVKSRAVYIDATDFVLHLAHTDTVTGIQRVTHQAIIGLSNHGSVKPILFSFATKRFYELPARLFDLTNQENRLNLKRIGRHVGRTLQARSVGDTRIVRRMRDRVREFQMVTKMFAGRDIYVNGMKAVNFERGDQLVILGAIWGMQGYIGDLREIADACAVDLTFFCHDMVPWRYPHLVEGNTSANFLGYMREIVPFCRKFVCNSDATRNDLNAFLKEEHCTNIPIAVVPLAHEFVTSTASDGASRFGSAADLPKKYILCAGTIEPRKNHLRLASAFRAALEKFKHEPPKLVIAGKCGWRVDDFYRMMEETNWISRQVIWIENPSDFDLERLYRSCDFTIYPSLFEGWGLPVGESLWFRKRCVSSRIGGIPEVGIDAVDYVDPLDVSSITAAIVRHAEDHRTISTFDERVAKAHLRSWSGFGSDLLNALPGAP